MDETYAIWEWMRQNRYSLTWVAEHLNVPSEIPSKALETKCISHRLADAFHKHFGIRIIADGTKAVRGDIKDRTL